MQLIERYIYDVTRRLPENEREEVKRELETIVADMLPDDPSERDITEALNRLGAPYKLAEQYRQKPKYLISPAFYDLYIASLKNVIVIVACVCACVGVFMGIGSVTESSSAGEIVRAVISGAFSFTFEGILMAAFWVTLGFAIADRSGYKRKDWSVNDLPNLPSTKEINISRSSTVAGAAFNIIFTVVFVTLIQRGYFFGGMLTVRGTEIVSPISQAALERLIPFIILSSGASLVLAAVKFIYARWNILVCAANTVYNIVWVSIAVYVISWPDLFNENFFSFLNKLNVDINFRDLFNYDGTVVFLPAAIAIIIIFAVMDIGTGVWNTVKGRR